jgi:glucose dehydrogenase
MHHKLLKISVLGLSILTFVSTCALAQQAQHADPIKPLSPVTEEMLGNPPASDWLMWRRTYDAWGYSPLDRINKGNVKRLQVAWTWALATGATEITPIVHDGVLFIFNYADKVQALNISEQQPSTVPRTPAAGDGRRPRTARRPTCCTCL